MSDKIVPTAHEAVPVEAPQTPDAAATGAPAQARLIARKIARRLARKQEGENGVGPGAEQAVEAAGASSGAALPGAVQSRFEGSLGADLSGVRVHTGPASSAAAESVGARAYAVGSDVHFAAGQYQPETRDGQQLLAHEVAHTVQQTRGGAGGGAQHKLEVSTPGDAHEVEADVAAGAMVDGRAASVSGGGGLARKVLQRDVTEGWKGAGAKDPNSHQTDVGTVKRIPIQGLKSIATGQAIVIVAAALKEDQPIEVMVHLHGWGQALAGARDENVDLLEQQVEASGRPMVGCLPRGTGDKSTFGKGKKEFDSNAFVGECLGFAFPKKVPEIQRTILSGHSGAGDAISDMLNNGNAPDKLGEVALFEAINGPQELQKVQTFVETRLNQDRDALNTKPGLPEKIEYLKGSLRFRAYYNKGGSYAERIGSADEKKDLANKDQQKAKVKVPSLRVFMNKWFTTNQAVLGGEGSEVYKALRANYQVIEVTDKAKKGQKGENDHDRTVGAGDHMKDALGALPDYAPNPNPTSGGTPAPNPNPTPTPTPTPVQGNSGGTNSGDAGTVGTGPDEEDG